MRKYAKILAPFLVACSVSVSPVADTTVIIGDSNCMPRADWVSYPDALGWRNLCIFGQRANQVVGVPVADRVVLAIGINDVTFGVLAGLSNHEQGVEAYRRLLVAAYGNGSELVCVLPPRTLRAEFHAAIDRLNAALRAVCLNYGAAVVASPELYGRDGVHLNEAAHRQLEAMLR